MSLLRMLVRKKNKEDLNSFESDQQTLTASTQITKTKIFLRIFPHKKSQVINVLLMLNVLSWSARMNSIHFIKGLYPPNFFKKNHFWLLDVFWYFKIWRIPPWGHP